MGEGRYRSLLCLAQVAVPNIDGSDGVRVEVLDPLDDRLEPGPLAEGLADPSIGVIMHAGRQDVALLRRGGGGGGGGGVGPPGAGRGGGAAPAGGPPAAPAGGA